MSTTVNSPVVDIGAVRPTHDAVAFGGATLSVNSEPDSGSGLPEVEYAPGPPPNRIRILLLAANPLSTQRLTIEEEARAIAQKLRLTRDRDSFELKTCWAVQPGDLLQYLNEYRPHIVHFSGHGSQAGDIVLSAGDGTGQPVAMAALTELFRVMRGEIRIVLLNACYTVTQAAAISQHIDFVIGTRAPIADEAATVFAADFYSALGFGRTVAQAFDQARRALMLQGLHGHDAPQLMVRPKADPHLSRGAAVNPNTNPTGPGQPAPTYQSASGQGINISGQGNTATSSSVTNINQPPPIFNSFDTKMLLGILVLDVVFFFYGMLSYTGKNTSTETWRAVIFLVMISVTVGMIRRWFRRRA